MMEQHGVSREQTELCMDNEEEAIGYIELGMLCILATYKLHGPPNKLEKNLARAEEAKRNSRYGDFLLELLFPDEKGKIEITGDVGLSEYEARFIFLRSKFYFQALDNYKNLDPKTRKNYLKEYHICLGGVLNHILINKFRKISGKKGSPQNGGRRSPMNGFVQELQRSKGVKTHLTLLEMLPCSGDDQQKFWESNQNLKKLLEEFEIQEVCVYWKEMELAFGSLGKLKFKTVKQIVETQVRSKAAIDLVLKLRDAGHFSDPESFDKFFKIYPKKIEENQFLEILRRSQISSSVHSPWIDKRKPKYRTFCWTDRVSSTKRSVPLREMYKLIS